MPSGGGDATLDPPQNEKCVFYFSDEVVQELADALSNGGILKEDEDEGEEDRDGNDNVIFKGNLDLEEAGLTKDTLRRLVLASYVTQATVGTELGIEVSYEELLETLDPNELSQLATSNETTPDEAGYYYVRLKDDTTGEDVYYTATRGSIKIENENGDLMTCVNNETFDYYVNWFNGNVGIPIGNGQLGKNTAITMYTVKEIGTIEMITVTTSSNGAYSFSTKTINYANNSEISECMVPIELLVDFLQFSASPQFLEAFERLIINQDITLRVFSLTTQETIVTERTYPIDIILNARKDLTFIKTSNSEGEYTILPDENGQVETASAGRDLTYNIASLQHTVQTTETTSSTDYDIKLISADSWYFKADRTVTKNTITTYEYYNAEGQSTAFTPSGENSLENAEGYDIGGFNITGIQSIDTLRSQLMSMLNTDSINLDTQIADINNKLQDRSDVQDIIDSYTSNQYVLQSYQSSISGITASSSGGTEKKVKTTVRDMIVTGVIDYEDNTDAFLGLWKNESGHYEEGATFDPDGKKVPYTDLYSGNKETAYVGDLFENADEMLFDVLEFSEHTQSYSSVMKYILYRYTGTDYGVTDFDDLMQLMGLGTTTVSGFYGSSVQEKVWWALLDAGYSKIAAAAVLGNIQWESGFDPTKIESGSGVGLGLCQWSYTRRTQLEAYIASKGTDTSDVNTQIEFLLAELDPNSGNPFADYQLQGQSSSAYDGNSYTASDWSNATDIATSTTAFMALFERPDYNPQKNHLSSRIQSAEEYYNQFKDMEKPTTDSRIGPINLSGDNAVKMGAMLTEALRIADDDRYYYSQGNRYGEFSYDCSSFVYRLYKQFFGFELPTWTGGNYSALAVWESSNMDASNFQPGDVLWVHSSAHQHVGIYIGNGQYVHASGTKTGIKVSTYSPGFFVRVYRYVE